jgi:hypothetical protein
MKAAFIILCGVLAGACSSGPSERKSSLDERNARMQAPDNTPHGERSAPSVPGAAEPGALDRDDMVETDFDRDRDGIADADEVNGTQGEDRGAPREGAEGQAGLTPIDQSNTSSDLEITQQIRKKVIDDDGLSFNAKNVKIITVGGKVTLRGPVESAQERSAIESSARAVPGVEHIDNQLQVER